MTVFEKALVWTRKRAKLEKDGIYYGPNKLVVFSAPSVRAVRPDERWHASTFYWWQKKNGDIIPAHKITN